MSEEENKLSKAKRMVRELTLKIEESNSKARLRMQEREKPKHPKRDQEQSASAVQNVDDFVHYMQVMRDLENVKQDLCNLKLEKGSVLEKKNRAENEAKGSKSRIHIHSKSVDALRQEIEEVNEEQVLVELAVIEASRELVEVEVQRTEEAEYFSSKIEKTKRNMNESLEKIDRIKELELKLALTNTDIKMFENEIKIVKELGARASSFREGNETNSSLVLKSVIDELEIARIEYALIREDGFRLMASMDVIREEFDRVSGKTARLKRKEDKINQIVQNLNSKLLGAKVKLEAVSSSEEHAKTIVDNLLLTYEHRKTETEASKKERELIFEEIVTLKAQIERNETDIELALRQLEASMQELEAVKLSELEALEKLENLAEKIMMDRALLSKHSSTITISRFEYGYLMDRAADAEKIANEKVAAARAWVEVVEANEKAIHMKTALAQRTLKEKIEEQETFQRQKSISGKGVVEEEWKGNSGGSSEVQNSEFGGELRRRSTKKSGSSTLVRRVKLRVPASPGYRHTSRSSSFKAKRKDKILPNMGKFFKRKSVEI